MRTKTAHNTTFTTGGYYLYRHIRLDNGFPFYIGIGTRQRGHSNKSVYLRANSTSNRSSFWKNIVNKAGFEVEILYETGSVSEIKQKEVEFIKLYGRKENGGILCNMTDGGDGLNPTKEKILKWRKTMMMNGEKEKNAERLRGFNKNRIKDGIFSRAKPVYVYELNGAFFKKYNSLKECSIGVRLHKSAIRASIINNRSTKKFIFSFIYFGDMIDANKYEIISNRPPNCAKSVSIFNFLTGEQKSFPTLKGAADFMGMKSFAHITRNLKIGKYKYYKIF
jgi:hypothetical protein